MPTPEDPYRGASERSKKIYQTTNDRITAQTRTQNLHNNQADKYNLLNRHEIYV